MVRSSAKYVPETPASLDGALYTGSVIAHISVMQVPSEGNIVARPGYET